MSESFDATLRRWCAARNNVPLHAITNLSHRWDEGFGGSDVTPPEDASFEIRFDVWGESKYVEVASYEMGDFVVAMVELAASGEDSSDV